MVMSLWWVFCIILIVALVGGAFAWINRPTWHSRPRLVANSQFLETLPSVRRSRKVAKVLQMMSLAMAALLVLGTAILAGRIASESVEAPNFKNRDIMLCLDVSGSMLTYDRQILQTYRSLVENFNGERVGLTIFNSTSRTVVPLTNDYGLVARELDKGIKALEYDPTADKLGTTSYTKEQVQRFLDFVEGTVSQTLPPSLIADGLASCGQGFDHADSKRSRFIILATDNEKGDEGVYTMKQAGDAVKRRDITLWSFYPGATSCGEECSRELSETSEKTGGRMWASSDPSAIPQIVSDIQKAEAAEMGATPRVVRTDHPLIPFVITLVATVGLIAVGWRSRS